MSAWAEVDALKTKLMYDSREARRAALVARRAELGARVVFAQTVDEKGRHLRRFAAYRTDAGADQKVVAYTETYNPNRPAKRKVSLDALHKMAARGEAWETADAGELLVTLDRWREQGAPRKRWATLKARVVQSTP